MSVLQVKDIDKSFGGVHAVIDFSLTAKSGEIHGIIGPNGAGKTTIFNVISGVYPPENGSIMLDDKNLTALDQYKVARYGIGRTFQNIRLFKGLSVLQNVMCANDPRSSYGLFGGIFPTKTRLREEKAGKELCESYLVDVGLKDYLKEMPENLPYGLQRRLEIARALASKPKVLLLDEPAAGLNPTEVTDLTSLILELSQRHKLIVLLIEHRLELVLSISQFVHVQNFGSTIAVGTPSEIKDNPAVIEAYLGKEE
ncbi:MAG: ABC transporter ATP-binding protein [Spirochaetia bacterium]|jgi:branched-chain amino acid transport system ATP-binding protein|nr:ABC transporter ATP-binding protein [Spirochaetia bacterium]